MQSLYKCLSMIAVVALVNGLAFSTYGEDSELPLPDFFCAIGACVDVDTQPEAAPTPTPSQNAASVNWNPGVYVGFKPNQFYATRREFESGWASRAQIESIISRNMCEPQHSDIKGARVRLEWREYEASPRNYSSGDELVDIMYDFLTSGRCGGIPRQLSIQTDFLANNRDAREMLCVPPDLTGSRDMFAWQSAGGVDRCSARVYAPQSATFDRYIQLWDHIANRYGESLFVEQFSPKLEGSYGINSRDSDFNSTLAQERIRDIALHIRSRAPRVPVTIGANNFSVGFHDDILNVHKVAMDATGGMGLSWPDTFADSATNSNFSVPPVTAHEPYYHLFQGDHMMWGEWQLAGNRFTDFESVWQSCCDRNYRNPQANLSEYVNGPPANTAYGSTHVVIISTFADFPVDDAIDAINRSPRGGSTFDETCPDAWLARGMQCVNSQGQVVR